MQHATCNMHGYVGDQESAPKPFKDEIRGGGAIGENGIVWYPKGKEHKEILKGPVRAAKGNE
jgi:hypothetical protein